MKITILGCGIFGSALESHLLSLGHEIKKEIIGDSELIFVCATSEFVVPVLLNAKNEISNQRIIICSKGFYESGDLMGNILEKEFPNNEILFLYGPTLAEELKNGSLSGMVLAGKKEVEELQKEIQSDSLIIDISKDVIGVQVGAALKNVVAILLGILEGAGYGENTKAFIFTRGVEEIQRFGVALGADENTFIGLTCVGDLTVCSRNRIFGVEFGKGKKIEDIVKEMNYTPEGLITLKITKLISEKNGIEIPLMDILYSILFEGVSIKDAIKKIK